MNIAIYITSVLYLIWLIIPLRQAKTHYFFYFLVLSVLSAVMLLDYFLLIHPAYFYPAAFSFLIISLFNFKKIPYYIFFLSAVLAVSILLPFVLSIQTITIILVIQNVIIFIIILKRAIVYSSTTSKLNIFHFVLLLYQVTLITRFIVVIGEIRTGIIFFYLSAAFGIFIGIYFLFYNEKNSHQVSLE